MRARYWSCSDFADWVRGTPKPSSETSEGWDVWEKKAKEDHPFRFWLAEKFLDKIQSFVFFPRDLYVGSMNYFNNRFIYKTHALTSNLTRGHWHDLDKRIFNCLFDELINFVEVHLAKRYLMLDKEKQKNFPKWKSSRFRSSECGTAYLAEETALRYDSTWVEEDDPNFGKPTPQAVAAQEILDLYHWWKHVRPARPDVYDCTGWTALCEQVWSGKLPRNDERYKEESRRISVEIDRIENQYEEEDIEMIIRLMRIRRHLWA